MAIKGHCMRGAVAVTVSEPAKESIYCHCDNCRRRSGATGTMIAVFQKDKVKVAGNVKTCVDDKTDSGTPMNECFCASRGSPIYSVTKALPDKIVIKMGLFSEIPKATSEWYCKNKNAWEPNVEVATLAEKTPLKQAVVSRSPSMTELRWSIK